MKEFRVIFLFFLYFIKNILKAKGQLNQNLS